MVGRFSHVFLFEVLLLKVGLNRLVLSVEIIHVRNEILDNVHMRKGMNLCGLARGVINFSAIKYNARKEIVFNLTMSRITWASETEFIKLKILIM